MTNLFPAELSRTLRQAITCAIFMSLSASPVLAAGVALREGSADWTAKAYDASTAVSNPAGLTSLDWNETVLQMIAGAGTVDDSASPTAGTIRGTYHIGATVVSLGVVSRF
jgi:hypothetical protein